MSSIMETKEPTGGLRERCKLPRGVWSIVDSPNDCSAFWHGKERRFVLVNLTEH